MFDLKTLIKVVVILLSFIMYIILVYLARKWYYELGLQENIDEKID